MHAFFWSLLGSLPGSTKNSQGIARLLALLLEEKLRNKVGIQWLLHFGYVISQNVAVKANGFTPTPSSSPPLFRPPTITYCKRSVIHFLLLELNFTYVRFQTKSETLFAVSIWDWSTGLSLSLSFSLQITAKWPFKICNNAAKADRCWGGFSDSRWTIWSGIQSVLDKQPIMSHTIRPTVSHARSIPPHRLLTATSCGNIYFIYAYRLWLNERCEMSK
jgi:hypothetical protein